MVQCVGDDDVEGHVAEVGGHGDEVEEKVTDWKKIHSHGLLLLVFLYLSFEIYLHFIFHFFIHLRSK